MTATSDHIEAWIEAASQGAQHQMLPGGRIFANVPACVGAVATGAGHAEADEELRGVLRDWAIVGLRQGDEIPVLGGVDLNTEEMRESVRLPSA